MSIKTALVAALVAFGAWSGKPALAADPPRAAPQAATRAPSVTVVPVVTRALRDLVPVTGTFVAREEALVTPEVEGLAIVEILAEEGDRVPTGQVLARLNRETIDVQLAQNAAQIARSEAAIAQARSQIAEAEANRVQANQSLARARTLSTTGATSAEVLDQRVAAARAAEARLQASQQAMALAEADKRLMQTQRRELELRLARTEIRARAAGIVSRRNARLGAVASAQGEAMFRIIVDGAIELEAEVPETLLARLKVGQTVAVEPIGLDHPIAGRVRLVAPEVNRQTRLGRVRVALEGDDRVAIGTFGRGQVEAARGEGLVVPLSAIMFSSQGASVQVVKDGVVETRRIAVGLRAEGVAEVREGLALGEEVVSVSGTFLRAGDRVTPVPAADRQASR